ncbi:MAG TPA: peptide ABC transporter substrate-binding protein [Terriglobia bacterium]|nr:peptide ABC transporter substrate-binding protein [Terriglobia bacterium]
MSQFKKTVLPAALAFSLGMALMSPAFAESVLNRGFGSAPSTLDPQLNQGARENYIIGDLYEGLVVTDPHGNTQPGQAEKWEVSADGKTWTFHLRDGLKWSNGDPVVAGDFVCGLLRIIDPKVGSTNSYYLISVLTVTNAKAFNEGKVSADQVGIKAPDDQTIVISLENPMPAALYIFTTLTTAPLHEASYEKAGNKIDYTNPANMVTNGAYVLKEFVPQSKVVLVRNPNYWDAKDVKIDSVIYDVTEDESTELKLYKSGAIDTTITVPAEQLPAVKQEMPKELIQSPTLGVRFLSLQSDAEPMKDIRVRKALSYAIDREFLQDKIEKIGNIPLYSLSVNQDPDYKPGKLEEAAWTQAQRNEKAKALLAEAGYGPNKPLTFTVIGPSKYKRRIEGIAAIWKKTLGIRVNIDLNETKVWLEKLNTGNWVATIDGYGGDYPLAKTWLDNLRHSDQSGYHWLDDKYEKLMDDANANAADKSRFYDYLSQAEQEVLNQYVTIPITVSTDNFLVKPYVKGWAVNPMGQPLTKYLSIEK